MSRSTWLAGARALLRFTRSGRSPPAPAQKRESPRAISVENEATSAPPRAATFDVGQEIRAVLGDIQPERARLEIAVQPDLVLHADRAEFHRVLADLVQHACSQALVSRVLVAASRSGASIQVSVSDDGVGADPGSRRRTLRPIERLLEQQGGSLEVASWPDQGTIVLTRWPEAGYLANGPGGAPFVVRERLATD
jgi:signal transduction histidine kinase